MKKFFPSIVLWTVVTVITLMISINPVWSSQKKSIKILVGAAEPDNGPYTTVLKEWGDELLNRTNGQVSMTYSFGGSIAKMGEFYDITNQGVCDMALALPTLRAPGQFPMAEIIGLPWVLPSSEITSKALSEYVKKGYVDQDFSDVKLLTASGGHGELLFTRNKPVTSLADLKGLKIHGSTPAIQHKIKLMGGTPVAVQLPDLYGALQKGVIDGMMGNWSFMIMFRLNEVLKFATGPGIGGVVFVTTLMNGNKWEKLPSDIQAVVDDITSKYSDKYAKSWGSFCEAGKKAFFAKGGQIVEWQPKDLAQMDKLFGSIWNDWIQANEKKRLPAQKAVDDMYHIIKSMGIDSPAIGYRPRN